MLAGSSGFTRRSALSVPNFRIYFGSAAIAQTGGWLLRTAQAWLVLDLTGTPAALALVTIAQALPVTILTLFAGICSKKAECLPMPQNEIRQITKDDGGKTSHEQGDVMVFDPAHDRHIPVLTCG